MWNGRQQEAGVRGAGLRGTGRGQDRGGASVVLDERAGLGSRGGGTSGWYPPCIVLVWLGVRHQGRFLVRSDQCSTRTVPY